MGCKKIPLEDKDGVTPKRIKTTGKESDSNCENDEHSRPARRLLSSLSSFQMNLIPEQMAVINAIRAGKSVFFTGSAGTGKSYLLKRLITMLPPQSTLVTASTGAAACHIGGTTLHVCAWVRVCVCVSLKTLRQIFSGRVICDAKTYISPSLTPSEIVFNLVHSSAPAKLKDNCIWVSPMPTPKLAIQRRRKSCAKMSRDQQKLRDRKKRI